MFVSIGSRAGGRRYVTGAPGGGGSSSGREVLTAARTYYVRTDGADSNNGLSDHSGGAFATIQRAVDSVAALDLSIYNVTISVSDGTYTSGVIVGAPWIGAGTVALVGNTTTPTNCVISTTSASCIVVQNGGSLIVRGFKLQTATSGGCVTAITGGIVTINGAMNYGATASGGWHLQSGSGSVIVISNAAYTISGGANWHFLASDFGTIQAGSGYTITVSGTPAFASVFCQATRHGLWWGNPTISGSATGTRFSADAMGLIQTFGGGASYFPGNASGTGSNPGASPYGLYS